MSHFPIIVNDISWICFKYEHIDYVIIGGDLNTELGRVTSLHTQVLNVFVQNEELKCCDMSDKAHIFYTHENVATST